MSEETEHRVNVVIGIFTLTMILSSHFYGIYPIVVWLIGMTLIGLILNAIKGRDE